jgi:hypothetical protein
MKQTVLWMLLFIATNVQGTPTQTENVKEAVDVIVLFCVAGGDKYEISGNAKIEGGLALKRPGVTAGAEIDISKSEARGLVEGLRDSMNNVTADQASEARKCMQPYIDRILDIILGKAAAAKPDVPVNIPESEFGDIFINWPPSSAPCSVNYHIEMAGQIIVPQGPIYHVPNIRLGPTSWTVRGEVRCADGSYCVSSNSRQSGHINLRRNATYLFNWGILPGSPIGSECHFLLSG